MFRFSFDLCAVCRPSLALSVVLLLRAVCAVCRPSLAGKESAGKLLGCRSRHASCTVSFLSFFVCRIEYSQAKSQTLHPKPETLCYLPCSYCPISCRSPYPHCTHIRASHSKPYIYIYIFCAFSPVWSILRICPYHAFASVSTLRSVHIYLDPYLSGPLMPPCTCPILVQSLCTRYHVYIPTH